MVAHLATVDDFDYLAELSPSQPSLRKLRLEKCGEWLRFRHYFTVGKVRLTGAIFCRQHLLCPLCAIRRGGKFLKAYLARFDVLRQQHPTAKLQLMTLTIRNGDHLEERFKHLAHAWKRLLKRRHLHRAKSSLFHVLGGVASFELTNIGNGWHPHVHCIILTQGVIDQQQLRNEWEAITADSFMCDVRDIEQSDLAAGFCEVFKYAVKFGELSLADNWHAHQVLHGRRLVSSFGVFRGVDVPENLLDDSLDDLPFIEMFYRYSMAAQSYSLKSCSRPQDPGAAQPLEAA